jgi:hypothetical protein
MYQGREEIVLSFALHDYLNLPPTVTEQLIQNQLFERKTSRS